MPYIYACYILCYTIYHYIYTLSHIYIHSCIGVTASSGIDKNDIKLLFKNIDTILTTTTTNSDSNYSSNSISSYNVTDIYRLISSFEKLEFTWAMFPTSLKNRYVCMYVYAYYMCMYVYTYSVYIVLYMCILYTNYRLLYTLLYI